MNEIQIQIFKSNLLLYKTTLWITAYFSISISWTSGEICNSICLASIGGDCRNRSNIKNRRNWSQVSLAMMAWDAPRFLNSSLHSLLWVASFSGQFEKHWFNSKTLIFCFKHSLGSEGFLYKPLYLRCYLRHWELNNRLLWCDVDHYICLGSHHVAHTTSLTHPFTLLQT